MSWDRLRRVVDDAHPFPEPPVSLAEVREQLQLDDNLQGIYLQRLVRTAVDTIEGPYGAGLALTAQTWDLFLDDFPSEIRIPIGPLTAVESIVFTDADGNADQVLATSIYEVDDVRGLVRRRRDQAWPTTGDVYNAVRVRFSAGFAILPEDMKQAVLMLVAHYHQNREAVVVGTTAAELPLSVAWIVDRYRRAWFA